MTNYGYMRVSTDDQTHDLQRNALLKAGIAEENLFADKISGTKAARPALRELEQKMKAGDTLTVWKLDRLGRSLGHLIYFVERMNQNKIDFRSLTENIDTTTPAGKCMFHMCGAFAQMERELISQRTKEGMDAARKRGQKIGRPGLPDDKIKLIRELAAEPNATVRWIEKMSGIPASTVQRQLYPKFPKGENMWGKAVRPIKPKPLPAPFPDSISSEFI